MKLKDSSLFEQPLNFVHQVKDGKHVVLFHEEVEYAKMISFQFIKSGLVDKKRCTYVSEEDVEAVEREMSDSGIDINKFTKNGLLNIYQVPSLPGYGQQDHRIEKEQAERVTEDREHANAILKDPSKIGQPDRIVFRCIYKVNTEDQIKSNLKWEHDYRLKNLKNSRTTIVCTYPVNDIIPTISDATGSYSKWMSSLLEIYDGVIFARRLWKGVAFNLA